MAAADEPTDHDQHDAPADPFGRPPSQGGAAGQLHHGEAAAPDLSQTPPPEAPATPAATVPSAPASPPVPNAPSIPAGGPRYAGSAPVGGPRYAGRPAGPGGPNFAGSAGATAGTYGQPAGQAGPPAPTPTGFGGPPPGAYPPGPAAPPAYGAGAPGAVGGQMQPGPGMGRYSPTAASFGSVPTYAPTATERGPQRKYKEFATSPLWAALAVVACYILGWAALVRGLVDDVSSYDSLDSARTDASTLTYVALLLFFFAWLALILWLYQIGNNAGTYGGGLLAGIALFPFTSILFALAGWIGLLAYYLIYFLWPARLLSSGIWKAGRLPPLFAIFGWAPAALGITLMVLGWQADGAGLVALGTICLMVTVVWWPVALVAVTIIQHIGIAQDRKQRLQARVA